MHYHLMNGTSGCIPDNVEDYESLQAAYRGAQSLFDDLCEPCYIAMSQTFGAMSSLDSHAVHLFETCDDCVPGADYVEIAECDGQECAA